MSYLLKINGYAEERVQGTSALAALATYVEVCLPDTKQFLIWVCGDEARLTSEHYTIEARRVPELQHA